MAIIHPSINYFATFLRQYDDTFVAEDAFFCNEDNFSKSKIRNVWVTCENNPLSSSPVF